MAKNLMVKMASPHKSTSSRLVIYLVLMIGLGNTVYVNVPDVEDDPCSTSENCDCRRYHDKIDVECHDVDDIAPVQELLRSRFADVQINKLTFFHPCYLRKFPRGFIVNASISQFISYCPIEDIEDNAFGRFRDLLKVIMENTRFARIPIGLRNLSNAKSLYIKKGRLEALGDDIQNLTEINYVTLKKSLIRTIDKDAFVNTPRIVYLELSDNQLTIVPEGTFDPLIRLRSIILSGNQLVTLDGAFKKLDPLTVDVSDNNLTMISNAFHDKTSSVKKLRLGKNDLQFEDLLSMTIKTTSITSLDIGGCHLERLDGGLVSRFSFLKEITASRNNLTELPKDLFHDMRSLHEMNLSYNKLTSVEGVFNGMKNLKHLNLIANKILSVDNSFIGTEALEVLMLSQNNIEYLRSGSFSGAPKILHLHLSSNDIRQLDEDTFSGLNHIETLLLKSNKFTSLNDSVSHLRTLKRLTVSSGKLETLTETDLLCLNNLPKLSLNSNRLTNVNGAFKNLRSLTSLNLSKNKLRTLSRDSFSDAFNITELWLGGGNKWECDCRLLWLLKWYKKTNGTFLKDNPLCKYPKPRLYLVPFRNLTTRDLTNWPEDCPESCECQCKPDGRSFFIEVDCSEHGFGTLPEKLPEQAGALFMNNNTLVRVNMTNSTVMAGIRWLDLGNNRIEELDGNLPDSLEKLYIDHNRLERPPRMLLDDDEYKLNELTLSGNPWVCDCDTRDFKKWLLSHGDTITDVNDTYCCQDLQDGALVGRLIISLTDNELCPSKMKLYVAIALATISLLLLCSSIGLAYFRYQLNVKVWLYAHGLTWVKEDEATDQDKVFDALLCCSYDNLEFAANTIARGLEKDEPHFNVCIPLRDITAGGNEIVDMLTAVSRCKRVIIILSRSYLKDEFCMEVFRSAFAIFLEEKICRLIVIQYGELPSKEGFDPSLKAILESSQTLLWQEKMFWSKLRYAMPKKTAARCLSKNDNQWA